jgi:signal transduction histidine kinase
LNSILSQIVSENPPPENIEIAVEDNLPTIICEETQILQVFQNLLSNAIKYMDKPEGQIKVGCVDDGNFWKFSVSDNGPGIDKSNFEMIFKLFQTLSPPSGVESTGIGLSIVRKIAELNGGDAWVESEVGKGSSFFFTLPKVAS